MRVGCPPRSVRWPKIPDGFELHLDRAPLKYSGLQPWEILISEAQERMTFAVPPDKLDAFLTLAAEMDVEATDLGPFTDSGYFHCLYQGETVAYLPMEFLHEGVPQMQIPARWVPPQTSEPELPAADIACDHQATARRGSISVRKRAWCAVMTMRFRPAQWSSR